MPALQGLIKLSIALQRQQDVELWNKWKESGKPEDFQSLYKAMTPYVSKVKGIYDVPGVNVPRTFLDTQAKKWFHRAASNYDPSAGDFHGYMAQTLNKLKSTVAAKQSLSRIPETRAYDVGRLRRAVSAIEAEKGTATPAETAERLGWNEKKVRALTQESRHSPMASRLIATPKGGDSGPLRDVEKLKLFRGELQGKDRDLYDLVFREKVYTTNELADRLGVSPATVSRMKNNMFARLRPVLQAD